MVTKKSTEVKQNLPVAAWGNEKWDQIKKMFIPPLVPEKDAILFMELAKAYDLNPFKKEIWIIPFNRWNKEKKQYEIITQVFCSRDGFLSIAHKSGMFNGMYTDFEYTSKGALVAAETIVWNKSCEHPVKYKAFFKEYTTGKNLWLSKPHVMIQKVSESSALRRAFNISGMYDPDEMPQRVLTEVRSTTPPQIKPPEKTEAEQPLSDNKVRQNHLARLNIVGKENGWTHEQVKAMAKTKYGVYTTKSLTIKQYEELLELLTRKNDYSKDEEPVEKEELPHGDAGKAFAEIEKAKSVQELSDIGNAIEKRSWTEDELQGLKDKMEIKFSEIMGKKRDA